ncbi:DUF3168 domain-containing protein [Sphingomonas sp. MG17]|uniref:DUF3168 domain-containing protein n=1 Tax=Sphingomonas tagetis TaxID=2949092 RepID=A0A9X2HHG8_9SPHN|nr:DUF3168 domain-containing protein [Sphingomonas tagetis]MCP3729254.1 DUF3168 domain-containing protein [Sphingomonas tagetis]
MAIDLLSAASDGFFALLDAAIDASTAEVTTNPEPRDPADQSDRRVVMLGEIESENVAGKGEQAERITVEVIVIYRGNQRSQLQALMHLVRDGLEDAVPAIAGVIFQSIDYLGAASGPPSTDGVTHAGLITFAVEAEPA